MKTLHFFLILIPAMMLLSCKNNTKEMRTVINPDGSCYREFRADGQPGFLLGDSSQKANPFPVEMDSSWKISWQYKEQPRCYKFPVTQSELDSVTGTLPNRHSSEVEQYSVFIRRDFKSVEDMAANFKLNPDHSLSQVKVRYSLENSFRWFYTYYHYRETYPKLNIKFEAPINKYMSKDEANFWFTGLPEITKGLNGMEIRELMGKLEDKYDNWLTYNIWCLEYKALIKYYDQIPNPSVSKATFITLKDSIYESKGAKSLDDLDVEESLNKFFKTNQFSVLWKSPDAPMKKVEDEMIGKRFAWMFDAYFLYKLEMPGTVIFTNSNITDGKTLVWHLSSPRFLLNNFTIEAESRKANIWAFLITGLIVVVAIGSFFFKRR